MAVREGGDTALKPYCTFRRGSRDVKRGVGELEYILCQNYSLSRTSSDWTKNYSVIYGYCSETGISYSYMSVAYGCWQICVCGFHFFLNGSSFLGYTSIV